MELKFSSSVALATFEVLKSDVWLVATGLAEHFHQCSKFYWPAENGLSALKILWVLQQSQSPHILILIKFFPSYILCNLSYTYRLAKYMSFHFSVTTTIHKSK